MVEAEKVEQIKQGVIDSYDLKIKALTTEYEDKLEANTDTISTKDASIRKLIIRSAFDRSEFLSEDTVLLPDMAYTYFGDRFGVEDSHPIVRLSRYVLIQSRVV